MRGAASLQDKGHSAVVLKAMGRAINKTVTIGRVPYPPAALRAGYLYMHVSRVEIMARPVIDF